jgi:uroporphyrin-III C-methyltransferase
MAEDFPQGSVWLVGAGPGDPELLTLKAARLIARADIVFYDALVGADILALAGEAELVPVGKRSGRHSRNQDDINALIVVAALAGKRVVRLKGGDPAMFARTAEEVAALAKAGMTARICPGVTTASAAAAATGTSLSLRGVARRVQFVTAHARAGETIDLDWRALADPNSTTAFYMGRSAAREISERLIGAGLNGATPVLVACDVSLANEKHVHTRLDLLPLVVRTMTGDRPTLILVGQAIGRGARSMEDAAAEAISEKIPSPFTCEV